jgi:hypothetical protein
MSVKSIQALGFVLVATMALGLVVAPVSATFPSQAIGEASGGIYKWYMLAPGESAEWVLHYPGNGAPALVAFGVDPADAIEVKVYDDWQWRAVGAGDTSVEPIGRGTPGTMGKWNTNNEIATAGNLFWEANAKAPVVFHIQATNRSQQPAQYWIAQTGPGSGELTPVSPLSPAYQSQPQSSPATPQSAQPSDRVQTPVTGAQVPPPSTLPVTGGSQSDRYQIVSELGGGGHMCAWHARGARRMAVYGGSNKRPENRRLVALSGGFQLRDLGEFDGLQLIARLLGQLPIGDLPSSLLDRLCEVVGERAMVFARDLCVCGGLIGAAAGKQHVSLSGAYITEALLLERCH